MRIGKTGIYSSHDLVPTPDSPSFSNVYRFTGDGEYYAKYADGSHRLLFDGGGAEIDVYIAGEILGGQRVVMLLGGKAVYYDVTDENNVGKKLGITNQSAIVDAPIEVVSEGVMGGFAGLVQDAVYYAGANGVLTNVIPTVGIFQRVGLAIDANTLRVDFSEPIVLI